MKTSSLLKAIVQNRIGQHVLFWMVSFYLLLHFFTEDEDITAIDYLYTALFHFTLVVGVYLNLLVWIPHLLRQRKYGLYVLGLLLTIAACAWLNILFFRYLVDFILPGYYFISYYELYDIALFFVVYVGLTTLLKLSKAWFQLAASEKQLAMARQQKLDAELRALKSQVNPHFLFNSLNNLYGLALKKDANTPAFILKLAEVMRYVLYEADAAWVPLEDEIHFTQNFIDLQKLRSDQRAHITFEIQGTVGQQTIAPLLFLPFIENSFKHGVKGSTNNSFVHIHLKVAPYHVLFSIENNKGTVDEVEKSPAGGIGLENVRQRLQLVYPDKHHLIIRNQDTIFAIQLKLTLT